MARVRYPIGIQTFRDIIEGEYLYVDKTEMVYGIAQKYRYVFLSRPRRFGKSLLTSTFEAYFKGEKELFKGLAMESLEKEWRSYPVLRFDFSGNNFNDPERLIGHIKSYLDEFEKAYGIHTEGDISVRFRELIREVSLKYGRKVVILIDEYDKPLLDSLHIRHLHENLKDELRGFYSVIKASDQYIRFALLTGITKFGRLSIFSGMNNLKDISLIPRYNTLCGISEPEFNSYFPPSISGYAEEHDISEEEAWKDFREMYDGYRFASRGEGIYNPYSVINAFDENELKNFWFDTGTSSFLVRLIEGNGYRLDSLEGQRRKEGQLNDITDAGDPVVPLLFQSGYLTIKGYDRETLEYTLGFPNREVYRSFWESLASHFFKGIDGNPAFNVRKCIKDINEGRPEDFMQGMRSLFADTHSEAERNKEIHFQNMMAIAAKMMGLIVRTEIHSARGRTDMLILTSNYVYVFEFKIDSTAEEAMAQIQDRDYAVPFESDPRTVFLIGANFSTETRTLDGWIIRSLHQP
ncbi:MAG: ATP-binding protein [Muribaculaceae bacterium]|nr:ATP-binding protein [Muribaculaceae bacterium]